MILFRTLEDANRKYSGCLFPNKEKEEDGKVVHYACLAFYVDARDPNFNPNTCTARALSTELLPQPFTWCFLVE